MAEELIFLRVVWSGRNRPIDVLVRRLSFAHCTPDPDLGPDSDRDTDPDMDAGVDLWADTAMHGMGSLGDMLQVDLPRRLGEPSTGPGCVEGGGHGQQPVLRCK